MLASAIGVIEGTETGTSGNAKSGPETAAVDETESLILLSNRKLAGFDGWRATPHRNCEASAAHAVGLGAPATVGHFWPARMAQADLNRPLAWPPKPAASNEISLSVRFRITAINGRRVAGRQSTAWECRIGLCAPCGMCGLAQSFRHVGQAFEPDANRTLSGSAPDIPKPWLIFLAATAAVDAY